MSQRRSLFGPLYVRRPCPRCGRRWNFHVDKADAKTPCGRCNPPVLIGPGVQVPLFGGKP